MKLWHQAKASVTEKVLAGAKFRALHRGQILDSSYRAMVSTALNRALPLII